MIKNSIFIFFLAFIFSCKKEMVSTDWVAITKIKSVDFEGLNPYLNKLDDQVYVVNFWATWCKPCVEELPIFEKLLNSYKNENVQVILVSLDFPDQIEKRLIPFLNDHRIKSDLLLMIDPDHNTWIPKISYEWSGAIPATLIYNHKTRKFYEQSFTYNTLEKEVIKFLNSK